MPEPGERRCDFGKAVSLDLGFRLERGQYPEMALPMLAPGVSARSVRLRWCLVGAVLLATDACGEDRRAPSSFAGTGNAGSAGNSSAGGSSGSGIVGGPLDAAAAGDPSGGCPDGSGFDEGGFDASDAGPERDPTNVQPILDCVQPADSAHFDALFGYQERRGSISHCLSTRFRRSEFSFRILVSSASASALMAPTSSVRSRRA